MSSNAEQAVRLFDSMQNLHNSLSNGELKRLHDEMVGCSMCTAYTGEITNEHCAIICKKFAFLDIFLKNREMKLLTMRFFVSKVEGTRISFREILSQVKHSHSNFLHVLPNGPNMHLIPNNEAKGLSMCVYHDINFLFDMGTSRRYAIYGSWTQD